MFNPVSKTAARLFARLRGALAAILVAAGLAGSAVPVQAPVAAVTAAIVLQAAPAQAAYSSGDPFGDVDQKGSDFITFVYKMLRWGALLGIAGAVALGFFGNLNWGTVFYIALGCIVVSIAPGLIDWLGSGQFSSPNFR